MSSDESYSSDESCSSYSTIEVNIPSKYEFLEVLGEGNFGVVLKCQKRDTGQIVAIKFAKSICKEAVKEVSILSSIKSKIDNLDNIVELIDSFPTKFGTALVFELLDISLHDYLANLDEPIPLADIRIIIKQMATALDRLKGIGVIHGDLHLQNIMLVNHQIRPFKFKLIDFGGAFHRSEATLDMLLQPLHIVSPEVALELPFSEAIDMWALGCVMFAMVYGNPLLEGNCLYEIMNCIVEFLGVPADYILNDSPKAEYYFNRTESNGWEFKTYEEFLRDNCEAHGETYESYEGDESYESDESDEEVQEENNKAEAVEGVHCKNLLKALLKIDPNERITPDEVLKHPFITQDYLNFQTDEVKTSRSSSVTSPNETDTTDLPSDEILVQPETDENTSVPDDWESRVSFWVDDVSSVDSLPSDEILVQPETDENTSVPDDWESRVSFWTDEVKTSVNSLPSDEILVQPETPENTSVPDDQESAVSFQSWLNKIPESSVKSSDNECLTSEESITHGKRHRDKEEEEESRPALLLLDEEYLLLLCCPR